MYITDYIKQFKNKRIKIYVDMDGVIADYDVGNACEYDKKRPLLTNIEALREVSKNKNVEMFILSITRMTIGRDEKNRWLDKYVEFIKPENRYIISREEHNFMPSKTLKKKFVKNIKRDESIIIVIDDDPAIIDEIRKSSEDVYLLKDTSLVK